MKNTLEKLWNEYLSSECAMIETDDERMLTRSAAELHERANALLDKEQITKSIAECLYLGISHDTGIFQYSCTSLKAAFVCSEM